MSLLEGRVLCLLEALISLEGRWYTCWPFGECRRFKSLGGLEQGADFLVFPSNLQFKTPGGRSSPRQAENSSSSHDSTVEDLSLCICMDCLSIHLLRVSSTLVLAEIQHFSLCRPTYISENASENRQSFQWLQFQVSSKRVEFQRNLQARLG